MLFVELHVDRDTVKTTALGKDTLFNKEMMVSLCNPFPSLKDGFLFVFLVCGMSTPKRVKAKKKYSNLPVLFC